MKPLWIAVLLVGLGMAVLLGWRWASGRWQLPCPSMFGWALESRFYDWLSGTSLTLQRMHLKPGQRILEMGPGPGRILLPAAVEIGKGGKAMGIDIQPGMVKRLNQRATEQGIQNLHAVVGDARQTRLPDQSFDLVFLATTLGEIPDRSAALKESFRLLRHGGVLSITELFGDPHYQSQLTVRRLANEAGFQFQAIDGHWWLYTANFLKP